MLYAALGAVPRNGLGGLAAAIAECRKAPGVVQILSYPCGESYESIPAHPYVAVVARGYWLARQALDRLMAQYGAPPALPAQHFGQELDAPLTIFGNAQLVDGRLRLWVPTASMEHSRALAAQVSGIAETHIDLRVVGSSRSDASPAVLAAAIALAREMQPVPVQVIMAPDFGVPALGRAAIEAVAGQESVFGSPVAVPLAA